MIARLPPALAALALAICLAGCAPDTAPAPTPTGFASEEEAFAAAEETYRAYVDALNRVDLSDPATFEDVYAWTTGDANAEARKSFSEMHASGWVVSGATTFDRFVPRSFTAGEQRGTVTVDLCLDVAGVDLVDSTGTSVVPESRLDRQAVFVTFSMATTGSGMSIETSAATENSCR